jgi:hypothetical protein
VKPTQISPPSVEEIQAEAQWLDKLIKRTTDRINSSDCNLPEFLHLELCRVEQQAYLAGLLYALGYPTILDRLEILYELDVSDRAGKHFENDQHPKWRSHSWAR